jgi:hypothetical protein
MSIIKINDVLKVDGNFKVISSSTLPSDNTPMYALYRSPSITDEGTTVTYTLATTNVAEGTLVSYTVTGISQADLSSGSLTGDFTVGADGTATVSFTIANDELTEGVETMLLSSGGQSLDVTINDTSNAGNYAYSLATETQFNGTSDYIRIPASPELTLGTGDFTIEFWCNFTNKTSIVFGGSARYKTIFSQFVDGQCPLNSYASSNRLRIFIDGASGALILRSNSIHAVASKAGSGAAMGLNDGLWHHVAFVRNGTTYRPYVDGKFGQGYTQSPVGNFNDSSAPYFIGAASNTCGFFEGFLDNFKITKGTALYSGGTAADRYITQHFVPPPRS